MSDLSTGVVKRDRRTKERMQLLLGIKQEHLHNKVVQFLLVVHQVIELKQ
jgi:hypothetical protein